MLKPIRVLILDACKTSPELAMRVKETYLERGCVVKFTTDRNLFMGLASYPQNYNFAIIFSDTENAQNFKVKEGTVPTTIFTPQNFSFKEAKTLLSK